VQAAPKKIAAYTFAGPLSQKGFRQTWGVFLIPRRLAGGSEDVALISVAELGPGVAGGGKLGAVLLARGGLIV
jgi:hypothetical protein